jgi:hypothetical protein
VKDIFLSYDLRNPGKNYEPLWDELKRFAGRRVLESLWEFRSDHSPAQLREHFKRFIDANDGLLVMDVHDWAGARLINNPSTTAV